MGMLNVGWEQVTERYGYGERNAREERLLEFASKNGLLITNTGLPDFSKEHYKASLATSGRQHVMFEIMDGQTRRGRPSSEWFDDIKEWCQLDIHTLSRMMRDRVQWREIARRALDINGNDKE